MIWFIILAAAIIGIYHINKYLLPVLRVSKTQEAWNKFNNGGPLE
jgi:hypothetical protein